MFERFTKRARRCIYFARQSASKYRSQTIETEHLLLGIVHEDPDVIWRFLPSRTAKDIRAEVESRLPKSTWEPPLCSDVFFGFALYLHPSTLRFHITAN